MKGGLMSTEASATTTEELTEEQAEPKAEEKKKRAARRRPQSDGPIVGAIIEAPSGDARRAMVEDLIQVQKEIENPKRTAINPFYDSKYAPLEQVLAAVKPILGAHNFALIQAFDRGDREDEGRYFTTLLAHVNGGMITSSVAVPAALSDAQKVSSYATYMRRVQLNAMIGIRDEDDDGNNASASSQSRTTTPARRPSAPQQRAGRTAPMTRATPTPAAKPAAATAQPERAAQPSQPLSVAAPKSVEGAVEGHDLTVIINTVDAIEAAFGDKVRDMILSKWGITSASALPASDFENRMGQVQNFVDARGKQMMITDDGGVLIQDSSG